MWGDGHSYLISYHTVHPTHSSAGILASLERSSVFLPQEYLLFPLPGTLVFHTSAWSLSHPLRQFKCHVVQKDFTDHLI